MALLDNPIEPLGPIEKRIESLDITALENLLSSLYRVRNRLIEYEYAAMKRHQHLTRPSALERKRLEDRESLIISMMITLDLTREEAEEKLK